MTDSSVELKVSPSHAVKKKKAKKNKKVPLSIGKAMATAINKPVIKKQERRQIIMGYHNLMKAKEKIRANQNLNESERKKLMKEVDSKVEAMGGLEAYQQASIKGHSRSTFGFDTGKYVVSVLSSLSDWKSERKLDLLDVGALTNHYLGHAKKINCTAIDLNPQHPSVLKKDFFDLDPQERSFDVVVLSLVLNFVGDKAKRGLMLLNSHRMLRDGGHLFVILPLPCVQNSRYLTHELFVSCLEGIGFQLASHKMSKKLAFYHCVRVQPPKKRKAFRLKPTVDGAHRNNFTVVIDPEV